MRLATFNVENMFERPSIMNLSSWDKGKKVLQDYARISDLIENEEYTDPVKQEMVEILNRNKGLISRKQETEYIRFRMIRGKFLLKKKDSPVEIVALGRSDWIGWFELKTETIKEIAIENTGRVIREVNADIFCVVEVDNRTALNRFNNSVIPKIDGLKYEHIMLIDGNDDRGIDVGIMTRQSFDIKSIVSHVDDNDIMGQIFSRDCPEYEIITPSGNKLLVLINHFKSKGSGSTKESNCKRIRQATKVKAIYEERQNEGFKFIAIAGDLNDNLKSDSLQILLDNNLGLVDIMSHPKFVGDGRLGTFKNGTEPLKLDYILMSPKLANKVILGGIERRGVWGGVKGTLFPHFPEIKTSKDAASDHAAIWVDFDL